MLRLKSRIGFEHLSKAAEQQAGCNQQQQRQSYFEGYQDALQAVLRARLSGGLTSITQ